MNVTDVTNRGSCDMRKGVGSLCIGANWRINKMGWRSAAAGRDPATATSVSGPRYPRSGILRPLIQVVRNPRRVID